MHKSDEHRFLLISVPHTKSTSARKWAEAYFSAKAIGGVHEARIPNECEGYLVWSMIRDPFERAVALWKKLHRGPELPVATAWMKDRGFVDRSYRGHYRITPKGLRRVKC